MVLTPRDFYGHPEDPFVSTCLQDYESIRVRRKNHKGPMDKYDRVILEMDKLFEAFYKKIL